MKEREQEEDREDRRHRYLEKTTSVQPYLRV